MEMLELDFTNVEEIAKKVNWYEKEHLNITDKGLGFEGASNSSRDVWIETIELLAVGVSWRAAQSTRIQAEIELANVRKEITLGNEETHEVNPDPGRLFVRHSPDTKNWSSWQEIDRNYADKPEAVIKHFQGTVGVPNSDRKGYGDYLSEYSTMDVPWGSDEEAAIKWILKEKNPNFFEEHIPFVGYLQFRYELSLRGGERLKNIKFKASYGVGGLHLAPKDKRVYEDRNGPWQFQSP
jgi:hypothetical protein